jgi:hypothetical protein
VGGLFILFLAAIYFCLSLWLILIVKPWWLKPVVLLVLVLIPTADAVYGRIKLKEICAKEMGLRVYRSVENVEGFTDGKHRPLDFWIKRDGYKFVEGETQGGKPARLSIRPDGAIVLEENVVPKSRYFFYQESGDIGTRYGYGRYVVKDMQSGEILGTETGIGFSGGWVEQLVGRIADSGPGSVARCNSGNPGDRVESLVTSVLKPAK